jgi:hypothetical protein
MVRNGSFRSHVVRLCSLVDLQPISVALKSQSVLPAGHAQLSGRQASPSRGAEHALHVTQVKSYSAGCMMGVNNVCTIRIYAYWQSS